MTLSLRLTWKKKPASHACPDRVSTSIRKTDPNRYVSPSARSLRHWMKRRDGWKSCARVSRELHGGAAKVAVLPQQTALYFASKLNYSPKASGAHVRENRG